MNFAENPQDLTANQRWIRLPKSGPCEWCGLSRSHLSELVKAGKIKSVSLRRPGNIRGIRLIWLPSIFAYISKVGVAGPGGEDDTCVETPFTQAVSDVHLHAHPRTRG